MVTLTTLCFAERVWGGMAGKWNMRIGWGRDTVSAIDSGGQQDQAL